jgi:Flp pilus assembly protein TadG
MGVEAAMGNGTLDMRHDAEGFLRSLARDKRGNTLAMMAIALIPLMGFVGSAVDSARMYVVKVRLQQACDAGVLAGRKFMTSSSSSTLDATATQQARTFFNNNFDATLFGSSAVSFTPAKTADQQVSGTATATVPMTLTKMMGFRDVVLNVSCEARFDVADIDVMFVLDTTGSMAYLASDKTMSGQTAYSYTRSDGTTGYYTSEKSGARIKALRTAVLNFYDTVADTADSTTKIRYGFVPYSSTVNVGKIIPQTMLVSDTYQYSTRQPFEKDRGTSSQSYADVTKAQCDAVAPRSPASGYDSNNYAAYRTTTFMVTSRSVELYWRFGRFDTDISDFIASKWVADPSKLDGSQSKWQGCIEERDTKALASFDQDNLPGDLDPDLDATSFETRWRPMWPSLVYKRNGNAGTVEVSNSDAGKSAYGNISMSSGWTVCPKQAQRLQEMTRAEVSSFVNDPDFRPMGGTYHDVGMIWGTRFLAPDGPFKDDTKAWPGRKDPTRHLVFMTDGQLSPGADTYGLYGFEPGDRRVTGGDTSKLYDRHMARFLAECQAAKNRNITVWVIAFGDDLTSEMQQCASSTGNAFEATSDAELNAAFQTIAARVAMLRISK